MFANFLQQFKDKWDDIEEKIAVEHFNHCIEIELKANANDDKLSS